EELDSEAAKGPLGKNAEEIEKLTRTYLAQGDYQGIKIFAAEIFGGVVGGNIVGATAKGATTLGAKLTMSLTSDKISSLFGGMQKTIMRLSTSGLSTRLVNFAKKFQVSPTKLGEYMGRLREAGRTKGNFDLPKGSRNEANFLGESWVGPNARQVPYQGQSDQFIYISQDGLKQFRPSVVKQDGRTLSNFQWKDPVTGSWIGNGHMEIVD
ncbi:MAG: hypothetical protein NTX25_22475, partial [Proteobacteria bacterium]|nr:hypothetical protein [Pseudomonadota bacterium]